MHLLYSLNKKSAKKVYLVLAACLWACYGLGNPKEVIRPYSCAHRHAMATASENGQQNLTTFLQYFFSCGRFHSNILLFYFNL